MVAMIPWTVIPLALLGLIFFLLQLYFLNTSGDVKRLECASEYQGSQARVAVQAGFRLCHNYPDPRHPADSILEFLPRSTLGNCIL